MCLPPEMAKGDKFFVKTALKCTFECFARIAAVLDRPGFRAKVARFASSAHAATT